MSEVGKALHRALTECKGCKELDTHCGKCPKCIANGWHRNDGTWQPIETAPEDGAWVILSDGEQVQPGYYWAILFGTGDKEWVTYSHRADWEEVPFEPTHWMPLPNPPKPSNADPCTSRQP